MLIRISSSVCAAAFISLLLAAAPFTPESDSKQLARGVEPIAGADVAVKPSNNLKPRIAFRKPASANIQLPVDASTGRPQWNGKLGVKFRDDLKFRADSVPADFVRDANGNPVPEVSDLLKSFGGSARQMLRRTPAELRAVEVRAEQISHRAQPDLAGMVYVDVAPDRLLEAARAFNSLDSVEWVDIERTPVLDGGGTDQSQQAGCGANGPGDGTGITNCYTTSPDSRCSTLGGGQGCNNPQGCQAPDGALPNCRYGCNNTNCCELVGALLPGCNDLEQPQGWDALCATYGNILCDSTVYDASPAIQGGGGSAPSVPQTYKYDPCFAMRGPVNPAETDVLVYGQVETPTPVATVTSQLLTYTTDPVTASFVSGTLVPVVYPTLSVSDEGDPSTDVPQQALPDPSLEGAYLSLSAGCFSEHNFGGCNQASCCVYVCRTDPSCCVIEWDTTCVVIADNAPAGTLLSSPCTSQELPTSAFPPAGVTPLLTSGRRADTGQARGYQNYTIQQPVLGPFDNLPAGVSYPVGAPTVSANTVPDPGRVNTESNTGTLASLNSGYRGGGLNLNGYDVLLTQLGLNPNTQGHGQGITTAVIEFSAYVNHEDLINVCVPEPNQTQVLVTSAPLNPNHGTSVLGIIGAERNTIGVTGIASAGTIAFYPTVSVEEGSRLENALINSIIDLGEGDVINMSIGLGGGDTILVSPTVATLVQLATSANIAVVVSAGNDASPCVTSPDGLTDTGAIVVGACWPGFQVGQLTNDASIPGPYPGNNYCRLNFSNFTGEDPPPGTGVTLSAWGTGVTSTGYGDLFNGDNSSTDPLQVNKLRSYTNNFNGTSAAAPIISGWCARVQSFCKSWYGTVLPTALLRQAISTQANIFQQCGISYASQQMPGYPEGGDPGVGDIVTVANGGIVAPIGGFPNCTNTISWIIANTLGGTAVSFEVITGTYQAGSTFSIRDVDNGFLSIASARRRAGSTGQGYGRKLFYPLGGGTTDVQLKVNSNQPPSAVSNVTLLTNSRASWNLPVIEIVYFYSYPQQRWMSAGYTSVTAAAGGLSASPPGLIADYITGTSTAGSQVYARVYTCGLGVSSYSILHDQLAIVVNVDIFNP